MKFKIKRENWISGVYYWTVPKNIFLRLWFAYNPFILLYYLISDKHEPYTCFSTKREAIQHIKRWNAGKYYKNSTRWV